MTQILFNGVVDFDGWGNPSTPLIGEVDILDVITKAFGWSARRVTVALADERFEGDLSADEGAKGYSEYTPGDPSKLAVGEHDLLDRLKELNGQAVTLWIADEPVNVLDA